MSLEGAQNPLASTASEATLAVDEQLRASRDAAPKQVTTAAASVGVSRQVHDADNPRCCPDGSSGLTVIRSAGTLPSMRHSTPQVRSWTCSPASSPGSRRTGTEARCPSLSTTGATMTTRSGTERQLVFGDGDGQVFDRFTKPMDVMAHEFTHAVTQFTAGLIYEGQSGALNESSQRCLCLDAPSSVPRPERRGGGLADRRGHLPARHQCPSPQVDERARHRVRRSADRQGSTGRDRWPTT